jgi:branched-chain amino acid transport system substrate-binding protein
MSLVMMIFLLILFNCSDSENYKWLRDKKSKKARGDILIGAVASWNLEKNEYTWEALQLAVDQVNGSGGIQGRQIKIIKEDDWGSLEQGLIAAKKLCANTDILVALGHSYSYISIPCSILYQYYGLILFSPTSDNPELSLRNGYDYIFQPSPTINNYVHKLVDYLQNSNLDKIIIFNQNDVFGNKYADYFEKVSSGTGISTISRIPYSEAAPEIFFKNRLLACKYFYDFNALLIAGDSGSAIRLTKLCHKYNIDVPILGTEKFDTEELIAEVMRTGEKVIFPSSFNENSNNEHVKPFVEEFKKKYGVVPRSKAAQWYNAMLFLAHAMNRANELTPSGIINSIRSIREWNGVLGTFIYSNTGNLQIEKDDIAIHIITGAGKIIFLEKPSQGALQ